MTGGTAKREEGQHLPKIPMIFLRPLAPNRPSLVPHRPSLVPSIPTLVPSNPAIAPSRPVVASLSQLIQQVDSAPLETLRNESTFLPKVA